MAMAMATAMAMAMAMVAMAMAIPAAAGISSEKKQKNSKNILFLEFSADHFGYGTVKIREISCFPKNPKTQNVPPHSRASRHIAGAPRPKAGGVCRLAILQFSWLGIARSFGNYRFFSAQKVCARDHWDR